MSALKSPASTAAHRLLRALVRRYGIRPFSRAVGITTGLLAERLRNPKDTTAYVEEIARWQVLLEQVQPVDGRIISRRSYDKDAAVWLKKLRILYEATNVRELARCLGCNRNVFRRTLQRGYLSVEFIELLKGYEKKYGKITRGHVPDPSLLKIGGGYHREERAALRNEFKALALVSSGTAQLGRLTENSPLQVTTLPSGTPSEALLDETALKRDILALRCDVRALHRKFGGVLRDYYTGRPVTDAMRRFIARYEQHYGTIDKNMQVPEEFRPAPPREKAASKKRVGTQVRAGRGVRSPLTLAVLRELRTGDKTFQQLHEAIRCDPVALRNNITSLSRRQVRPSIVVVQRGLYRVAPYLR